MLPVQSQYVQSCFIAWGTFSVKVINVQHLFPFTEELYTSNWMYVCTQHSPDIGVILCVHVLLQ